MSESSDVKLPTDWWKQSTLFLAGVVLTLVGAYFANQKDVMTKTDFQTFSAAQQQQINDVKTKVDIVDDRTRTMQMDITAVKTQLGVDDGTIDQPKRKREQ